MAELSSSEASVGGLSLRRSLKDRLRCPNGFGSEAIGRRSQWF